MTGEQLAFVIGALIVVVPFLLWQMFTGDLEDGYQDDDRGYDLSEGWKK